MPDAANSISTQATPLHPYRQETIGLESTPTSPPRIIEDFEIHSPGDGDVVETPPNHDLSLAGRRASLAASSSRLIQDAKGKHIFIGDSANLSFLQSIRQLVSVKLGYCLFIDGPLKFRMVEASPNDHSSNNPSRPMPVAYLISSTFTEDPSIMTVQVYALITMYLLGASRRNAAFMYLGIAVRAAYALGLHREDVASLFPAEEYRMRERGWRVIRILDLFMSASLGRPPSTSETRDTSRKENYSASADLCALFELILNEVYSKRMVSAEALKRISGYHCAWSKRFTEGLLTDHITPESTFAQSDVPNVGLLHLKEAYYWTIILSTRPYFLEYIASQSSTSATPRDRMSSSNSDSAEGLAYACVDSAIKTIDLLYVLREYERTPKRLPFVVNSVFVWALVIEPHHLQITRDTSLWEKFC
ncbi:hypothetical protein DL98DRAFT_540329 [Cadophora sp. DSE1049]|nr:hypothetical protein DL98DRAFT_540329 [Cadophora sp. DSE1049]